MKHNTMKALVQQAPGQDFVLSEMTLPVPTPGPGQLLVKIDQVGLNPVDTKLAYGGHSAWQWPHIPGLDAVGTVVDSHENKFALVGERVMWHGDLTRQGVLAEYAVIEAHAVTPLPASVSSYDAIALLCPGMTAGLSLCRLNIEPGQNLMIEAGSGAVGQLAIQLAKLKNATVFTTARQQHHCALKKLGADEVFDYTDPAIEQKIRRTLGTDQLDAVIDSIGGDTTARNIRLMRFSGQLALLNGMPDIDPGLLFRKAPSVHIISLGGAWLSNDLCAQQQMALKGNHLADLLSKKQLKPLTSHVIPFTADDVTRAMHRQMESGLFGKQIVDVEAADLSL